MTKQRTTHTPKELMDAWGIEVYVDDYGEETIVFNGFQSDHLEGLKKVMDRYGFNVSALHSLITSYAAKPNHELLTARQLLDAYFSGSTIWRRKDDYKENAYVHASAFGVKNMVQNILANPSVYTLTDPNKVTPTIGQELTLEQLHDVEFMRRVTKLEVWNPYGSCKEVYSQGLYWKAEFIKDLSYAITHKHVGWSVTVAEVVEEGGR